MTAYHNEQSGEAEAPPSRPCPSEGTAWHGARLIRGFGFAEDWLHLGRTQARWASPKTGCTSAELKQGGLRRSPSVSAMPKRGDGLAWRSTYSGLWFCTRFAQSLLRCFGFTENRLYLGQKQCKWKAETKLVLAMLRRSLRSLESTLKPIGLVRLSVCTVFRDSNSVTNRSAIRTQRASLLALC